MPNSKRMNRKLHRAGQLIRKDLEPRLQRLEAENEELRLMLSQPPAEAGPAEPAPEAQAELRLLRELTELAAKRTGSPIGSPAGSAGKASHAIQPSGGGLPAPDLRAEYERRVAVLRPGDVAGLMEVKREFRKRGMEIY
jgi:hypothetical protein